MPESIKNGRNEKKYSGKNGIFFNCKLFSSLVLDPFDIESIKKSMGNIPIHALADLSCLSSIELTEAVSHFGDDFKDCLPNIISANVTGGTLVYIVRNWSFHQIKIVLTKKRNVGYNSRRRGYEVTLFKCWHE